ncbi:endochitinase-like [Uranotaenia lowii]|uniref:endochitinase-like n=1 Tax=Uranotaenia lowii TaxID=190385 RepID=UPI0024794C17|nr:endochitinase-like [Uranotaenia lowii]
MNVFSSHQFDSHFLRFKMRLLVGIVFALSAFSLEGNAESDSALTVCYFSNWAVYRQGLGRYSVDDIPEGLCTHILYAFVGFSKTSPLEITGMTPADDTDSNGLRKFSELRSRIPDAKLLVSVGGWNENSTVFSTMMASKPTRVKFARSVVKLLDSFQLDGFNFHWLWPGNVERGGTPDDLENFPKLLKEMRTAFRQNGRNRHLSVIAPVEEFRLNEGYDIDEVCSRVNHVFLSTYDLRGSWNNFTDVHTPMTKRTFEPSTFETFNVNAGVDFWLNGGCPSEKIILGVATLGRSYKLQNSFYNGLGAPAIGAGSPGEFTASDGYMAYYEICRRLSDGWKMGRDPEGKIPYATKNDQWVGYDDVESLKDKVKLVKGKKLGGVMVYALDMDDFKGVCGNKRYPLTSFISAEMKKSHGGSSSDIIEFF